MSSKEFLVGKNVHVRTGWLTQCIEFVKTLNPKNDGDRNSMVYTQFLNADLAAIGVAVLKETISKTKDTTIKGKYVFQVNSIRDITMPTVEEIIDDSEEKEKIVSFVSSQFRTLQLVLTDGGQKFNAIELVMCPQLSKNVKRGTKVIRSINLM
jgi:hypothetical protein